MGSQLRVCAHCRVLVRDGEHGWEHVPEFAAKFTREVCDTPAAGRETSGSEERFGLARKKTSGGDKLVIKGALDGIPVVPGAPVVVAVDGSYKLHIGEKVRKPMSWAFVTDAGRYGLGTSFASGNIVGGRPLGDGSGRDPQRALQAELRAIANALQAVGDQQLVTVLTDSRDAESYMTLWRLGHQVMPGGYNTERAGGRESTLTRLARRAHEAGDRIQVQWVQGHSGHPLNECADALAKMARGWAVGRLDKETVALDARRTVRYALTRHANELAA